MSIVTPIPFPATASEAFQTPQVPACLEPLLRDRLEDTFDDANGWVPRRSWAPPGHVSADAAQAASAYLSAVEPLLREADRGHLLSRVYALLAHYKADPQPPEVERMIAEDWADDLGEFPMWAVEEAARLWRRTKKWRPKICEIRALCEEAVSDRFPNLEKIRALANTSIRQRKVGPRSTVDRAREWWFRQDGFRRSELDCAARTAMGNRQAPLRDVMVWAYERRSDSRSKNENKQFVVSLAQASVKRI